MLKIFSILSQKQKRSLIILLFLSIIAMILELLGITLIIPMIYTLIDDNFFTNYPKFTFINEILNFPEKETLIQYFLITILAVYVSKNIFLTFFQWYEAKFLNFTRESISHKLFGSFLRKNLDFHLKTNSSTLVTNIRQDLGEYFNGLTATVAIFTELIIVGGLTIFLLFYEPKAFVISALVILIFSFVLYFLTSSKFKKLGKDRNEIEILRTKKLQEGFGGIKEIKSFKIENAISKDYKKLTNSLSRLYTYFYFLSKVPKIYFELIAIVGVITLTFFLISEYENSTKIVTSIGIFSAAAFKMLPSFNRIQHSFGVLKYVSKAVDALVLNFPKIENSVSSNSLDINDKITFKDVDFKYPGRKIHVLKKLNLEICLGEKILISGITGSGKSTLIDLILGLHAPSSGEILIDGKLSNVEEFNWFDSIGYVPQNIYLFDESIEYNITLQEPEKINREFLEFILKISQLKDFTNNLPNKLQTLVGEKGAQLSGGQKQRIGIARALYKNPKIIILDEATNSLDYKTEEKFLEELNNNFKKNSIITISHKKNEKDFFDKKYTLKDGALH